MMGWDYSSFLFFGKTISSHPEIEWHSWIVCLSGASVLPRTKADTPPKTNMTLENSNCLKMYLLLSMVFIHLSF